VRSKIILVAKRCKARTNKSEASTSRSNYLIEGGGRCTAGGFVSGIGHPFGPVAIFNVLSLESKCEWHANER